MLGAIILTFLVRELRKINTAKLLILGVHQHQNLHQVSVQLVLIWYHHTSMLAQCEVDLFVNKHKKKTKIRSHGVAFQSKLSRRGNMWISLLSPWQDKKNLDPPRQWGVKRRSLKSVRAAEQLSTWESRGEYEKGGKGAEQKAKGSVNIRGGTGNQSGNEKFTRASDRGEGNWVRVSVKNTLKNKLKKLNVTHG